MLRRQPQGLTSHSKRLRQHDLEVVVAHPRVPHMGGRAGAGDEAASCRMSPRNSERRRLNDKATYICTCTHTNTPFAHLCTRTCLHTYTHMHTYSHKHTHTPTHTNTQTLVYTCPHAHTNTQTNTQTNERQKKTYAHTCTQGGAHTHTHTHTRACVRAFTQSYVPTCIHAYDRTDCTNVQTRMNTHNTNTHASTHIRMHTQTYLHSPTPRKQTDTQKDRQSD